MAEIGETRSVFEISEWHQETHMDLRPFVKSLMERRRNRFFIGDSSPEGICPIEVASIGGGSVTIIIHREHTQYYPDIHGGGWNYKVDVDEDGRDVGEGVFIKEYSHIDNCVNELSHIMYLIKQELE